MKNIKNTIASRHSDHSHYFDYSPLILAVLTSSLFIVPMAQAAPLPVVGITVCDTGVCMVEGVDFVDPTGTLTVADAVDIGETSGISVTASGGNGGTIQFDGLSKILGTVTVPPAATILDQININNVVTDVTAQASLNINQLYFTADGIFRVADGADLTAASVETAVADTGVLVFEGSSEITGGDIGLVGTLLKTVNINSGTVTLEHNIYATNTTIVSGATLVINDTGKTIATNLVNTGTLSIGLNALTVGTYMGGADSVLNIGISGSGMGSLAIVTPNAPAIPTTSTLNFVITGNDLPGMTVFNNIITAPSDLDAPGPIINNTPLYTFVPTYNSTDVDLTVTQISTLSSALVDTPSLAGVSDFFDTLGPTISVTAPDLVPLYDAIRAQTTTQDLADALSTAIPTVNGHLRTASYLGFSRMLNIAVDRMGMGMKRADNIIYSSGDDDDRYRSRGYSPCDYNSRGWISNKCKRKGFWIEGFAAHIDQDIVEGTSGYGADGSGLALGGDTNTSPCSMVGWGFAYTKIDRAQSALESTGFITNKLEIDSFQGLVYGRYDYGRAWYTDAILGLAYNYHEQDRFILAPAETAHSNFYGWQFNAYGETGYELRCNRFLIVPHAVFGYSNLFIQGYTESVSDPVNAALALSVKYDNMGEVKLGGGLKLAYEYGEKDASITPYIKLIALHDFRADGENATASFLGLPGVSFRALGPTAAGTSFVATGGLLLGRGMCHFLTMEYNYEHSERAFDMHSGFIKYRYTWM